MIYMMYTGLIDISKCIYSYSYIYSNRLSNNTNHGWPMIASNSWSDLVNDLNDKVSIALSISLPNLAPFLSLSLSFCMSVGVGERECVCVFVYFRRKCKKQPRVPTKLYLLPLCLPRGFASLGFLCLALARGPILTSVPLPTPWTRCSKSWGANASSAWGRVTSSVAKRSPSEPGPRRSLRLVSPSTGLQILGQQGLYWAHY